MIVTHTSNPSIDYYLEIPGHLMYGIQRASSSFCLAGGKGLNASMILNQLEISSVATAFVGGFTGEFIKRQISDCKYVELGVVDIADVNRINVKIRGSEETDINAQGPIITNEHQEEMLNKFKKLNKEDWLLICGSLARNVTTDFLIRTAEIVKEKEAKLVLDVPGIKANLIAECQPHLIKPNIEELYDMFDLKPDCGVSTIELIKRLNKMGIQNILLSKGSDGAEFYGRDKNYLIIQPALESINTVGSGDSMLATTVGMLAEGKPLEEALALGAAAGAATATSKGLATKEHIEKLKETVIVKTLRSDDHENYIGKN